MSTIATLTSNESGANSLIDINANFAALNTDKLQTVVESNLTLADNTTADVSTIKHGFVPKAPNDITKYLRGDGTWALASTTTTSNTGNYNGDTATNRAVPHGIGTIPKWISITSRANANGNYVQFSNNNGTWQRVSNSATISVTAMDATNFYVSDGASSNNASGVTYDWVALK